MALRAVQVSSAEHTLQGPQHDYDQQHHQYKEEDQPLPVRQSAQQARRPGSCLDGSIRRLTGPDVDADAEGHGAVGGARHGVLPRALVAQLLALQPHGLLLLLVAGQLAEDLPAGGQGRGSLLGQHGGVTAEGAREARAATNVLLVGQGDRHEAGKALQAEGVSALQQLGRFEDIVVGVVADGALRLAPHGDLLLHLSCWGALDVPDLLSVLLHL